jgi:hypothetical protein
MNGLIMDKAELANLVDQVFATYNQELPMDDKSRVQLIYKSWYDLLHDLSYADCKEAFLILATTSTFMPKAGEIRRSTINRRTKIGESDEPIIAWGKFQRIMEDANAGVMNQQELQEPLIQTVRKLGAAAAGMHTNGDREHFIRVYEKVIIEIEGEKYKVPLRIEE